MSSLSAATLVTGGAGFIGAHLVAYLSRQGKKVIVIDDLSSGNLANLKWLDIEVEFIEGDIGDPSVMQQLTNRHINTIYHLASQADVPLSVRQPLKDFKTNVQGTLNILELAKSQDAQVVFTSSVAVYAKNTPKPIRENAVIHASSPYGAAKAAAENYCYAYTNCYGVRTVIARLFNVYGPLMSKYVIYDFVRKLQNNPKSLTIIGSGNQIRDYTYVDDTVRALVLLAEKGQAGTAYNVGNGIPTRIIDLAGMISQAMDLSQVEMRCTNEEVMGDISEWYADITRIRRLGFEPQVQFSDGLRKTVQFILQSG